MNTTPAPQTPTAVKALCDAVMRAVATSGAVTSANLDQAVAVIRAEVKAFVLGDDQYAGARAAVAEGTLHPAYAVNLVAAECVAKIGAAS